MSKTRKQRNRRRQAAKKNSESFSEIENVEVDRGELAVRYSLAGMAIFAQAIGEEVGRVSIGREVTPRIRFSEEGQLAGFLLDPSDDKAETLRRLRHLREAPLEYRMRAAVAQLGVIHAGLQAIILSNHGKPCLNCTRWAHHLKACHERHQAFLSDLDFDDDETSWKLDQELIAGTVLALVSENWPLIAWSTWEGPDQDLVLDSELLSAAPEFPSLAREFWVAEEGGELKWELV